MKHKRNLISIMIVSLLITLIGFIVDLGERVPNILVNIFEISMMTLIIFGIISSIYLVLSMLTRLTNKV